MTTLFISDLHLDPSRPAITDLFLAFPPLLLAMAIVAALGPGLQNATLALVMFGDAPNENAARTRRRTGRV